MLSPCHPEMGVTLDHLDGCQDEEEHGEDEEMERHGDLVNTMGPQVHGQSEGRVLGLKQGDGDDGSGVGYAVSPTVANGQTNNKTELFRSKFCPKNRAFPEPFMKENRARTVCFPSSYSIAF